MRRVSWRCSITFLIREFIWGYLVFVVLCMQRWWMQEVTDIFSVIASSYNFNRVNYINVLILRVAWVVRSSLWKETWILCETCCFVSWLGPCVSATWLQCWTHLIVLLRGISCRYWLSVFLIEISLTLLKANVRIVSYIIFSVSQWAIVSHWVWVAWDSVATINHIVPSLF